MRVSGVRRWWDYTMQRKKREGNKCCLEFPQTVIGNLTLSRHVDNYPIPIPRFHISDLQDKQTSPQIQHLTSWLSCPFSSTQKRGYNTRHDIIVPLPRLRPVNTMPSILCFVQGFGWNVLDQNTYAPVPCPLCLKRLIRINFCTLYRQVHLPNIRMTL